MHDPYYPAGSDNKYAPWNQKDNEQITVDATCSQTLCKSLSIDTTVYDDDYNIDEESWCEFHYTPLLLIRKLKEILIEHPNIVALQEKLIKECEDWDDVETTVIED